MADHSFSPCSPKLIRRRRLLAVSTTVLAPIPVVSRAASSAIITQIAFSFHIGTDAENPVYDDKEHQDAVVIQVTGPPGKNFGATGYMGSGSDGTYWGKPSDHLIVVKAAAGVQVTHADLLQYTCGIFSYVTPPLDDDFGSWTAWVTAIATDDAGNTFPVITPRLVSFSDDTNHPPAVPIPFV